jgi:hypothetical protein
MNKSHSRFSLGHGQAGASESGCRAGHGWADSPDSTEAQRPSGVTVSRLPYDDHVGRQYYGVTVRLTFRDSAPETRSPATPARDRSECNRSIRPQASTGGLPLRLPESSDAARQAWGRSPAGYPPGLG